MDDKLPQMWRGQGPGLTIKITEVKGIMEKLQELSYRKQIARQLHI